MEYVEGETLRRKIELRPLKLTDAIDFAIQIAKGLAAAHAKGVVHRDIKSNNVMITPDGQAKILDFGLARGRDSKTITEAGACIGTPAYMAPEQVRGETVDRRADIWALGILIYEMLSGKAPFESESPAAGFYRILDEEPEPLTAVRQGVPVELDRIVFKAIAKDPAQRYQHVEEIAVDLQALRQRLSSDGRRMTHPVQAVSLRTQLHRFAIAGAGVLLHAAAGWFAWTNLRPEGKTMRFISRLPEGHAFSNVDFFSSAITISRDGSSIVYVAREGKKANLWRRTIGEEEATVIEGTEGGLAPFLSADKQWVGYVEGNTVKRVNTLAGAPQTVETSLFRVDIAFFGGAFSPDGQTIVASECTRGLRKFAISQKAKSNATDVYKAEKYRQHQFPQVLPGGRYVLYTQWGGRQPNADVFTIPTDGRGQAKPFLSGPELTYHAEFSPDGKWVAYTSQASTQPSTVAVRSVQDPAHSVQVAGNSVADPVWSRDGKRLYFRSRDGKKIFAVDFNGNGRPETSTPRLLAQGEFQPVNEQGRTWDVSPDGQRFLVWLRDLPFQPPTEYHVVLNWDRELKRLAPASD